jgi:hypothetical protein
MKPSPAEPVRTPLPHCLPHSHSPRFGPPVLHFCCPARVGRCSPARHYRVMLLEMGMTNLIPHLWGSRWLQGEIYGRLLYQLSNGRKKKAPLCRVVQARVGVFLMVSMARYQIGDLVAFVSQCEYCGAAFIGICESHDCGVGGLDRRFWAVRSHA